MIELCVIKHTSFVFYTLSDRIGVHKVSFGDDLFLLFDDFWILLQL